MRPSDQYAPALHTLAKALEPIACAAKALGDLDACALAYALEALEAAQQWRKDMTDTARRRAATNAGACQALALAPVTAKDSQVRRALAGFGAAVLRITDGDCVGAMRAAEAARACI